MLALCAPKMRLICCISGGLCADICRIIGAIDAAYAAVLVADYEVLWCYNEPYEPRLAHMCLGFAAIWCISAWKSAAWWKIVSRGIYCKCRDFCLRLPVISIDWAGNGDKSALMAAMIPWAALHSGPGALMCARLLMPAAHESRDRA